MVAAYIGIGVWRRRRRRARRQYPRL